MGGREIRGKVSGTGVYVDFYVCVYVVVMNTGYNVMCVYVGTFYVCICRWV